MTAAPLTESIPQSALQALIQAQHDTPVLMSLFDRNDMLLWANPAFRQAFGLEEDQMLTWSDLARLNHRRKVGVQISNPDLEAWIASTKSRRGKQSFRAFESDLQDGRWIWMTETVNADGCMLCIACDITSLRSDDRDLRQERDLAQRAALTDALTGISNRAHMMSLLEQQLQLTRIGRSCGLALIDLDFFKRINDTYGHGGGDTVLQHFSRLLRQMLRREDCFGRIGGEEFLVLLPGACPDSLTSSMQRLLDMLPLQRPLQEHPDFYYTCSVGTTLLHHTDTATSAIQRADQALYAAKSQGRHRVVQTLSPD